MSSSANAEHGTLVLYLMQVLWPAFIGAAITVGVVFSSIDPAELTVVALYLGGSREGAYTVGFLFFWVLYSLACSLTWYLARTDRQA